MTTSTATRPTAPALPLILSSKRVFVTTFATLLPLNLILLVVAFSFGYTTGLEGEFGFSWDGVGTTISTMFGSFGSFVMLLAVLALLAVIFRMTNKLASKRSWLPGALVLTALAVGAVPFIFGWISLKEINLGGLVPFLGVVIFTAVTSAVITLALRYTKRKTPNN